MPQNRFQMILQFIYFPGNTYSDPKDPNRGCLYKVRPIVECLVDKFKSIYIYHQSTYLSMKNCFFGKVG